MKKIIRCLLFAALTLPVSSAFAFTTGGDLEASLIAGDISTANIQLAEIRKNKSLDGGQTVGYMLLTEAFDALNQFQIAASKFTENKQVNQFADVERTFQQLAKATRSASQYSLPASRPLIAVYNEKIQEANATYTALREESKMLAQQQRELALAEEKQKQEEQRARWAKEEQERQLAITKQNEEYQQELAQEQQQVVKPPKRKHRSSTARKKSPQASSDTYYTPTYSSGKSRGWGRSRRR